MHFIQLILQIFNLLADSILAVYFFICLRLSALCLAGYRGHLEEFIDRLLHQHNPLTFTVAGHDLIFFLIRDRQLSGQRGDNLAHALPLHDVGACHDAPLIIRRIFQESGLHLIQIFFTLVIRQIQNFRTFFRIKGDVIFIHLKILNIEPVRGFYADIPIFIDGVDRCAYADRIKIIRRHIFALFIFLQHEKIKLFSGRRLTPGQVVKIILLKENIDTGDNNYIVKRYGNHSILLCAASTQSC